jgi:hypothetical protein
MSRRQIFVQTGVIAHHGYRRPSGSWRTASCFGARHLPFEAGCSRLVELIAELRQSEAEELRAVKDIDAEIVPVALVFPDRSQPFGSNGRRPDKRVLVTRDIFDQLQTAGEIARGIPDVDRLKTEHIAGGCERSTIFMQ